MKKTCLALLLAVALLFAGCGSDPLPVPSPDDPPGPGTTDPDPGKTDPDPDPGKTGPEDPYTVSLTANGRKYVPNIAMNAVWKARDGRKYTAAFDGNGNATLGEEVTGEFSVGLSAVPAGYAYNPNLYTATDTAKNTAIELVNCFSVAVTGTEPAVSGAAKLTNGNVYCATFESEEDRVWFLLDPCDFETWCSVSEDNVLPVLKGYIGNSAGGFYNEASEQDLSGGGAKGAYTENVSFRWGEEMGSLSFFVMQARSQAGYPVSVCFKISPPSGGSSGGGEGQQGPVAKVGDPTLLKNIKPEGRFVYNYTATGRLCDGSRFKLFPRGTTDAEGHEGDDYWHVYDASANVYRETLFAMISEKCGILDVPLTDSMIRPTAYGVNYRDFLAEYAKYCNSDGAHPLTEELRVFLQGYAIGERYFNDGNGWAETNGRVNLQASEEDQWLFCVGYYVS